MKLLSEQKTKTEHLLNLGINYLENRWEYTRLIIAEKASILTGTVFGGLVTAFFSGLIIFLLSIGLAIYVGNLLNNLAVGFFMLSLLYVLLMVIVLKFIKPIIVNKISTHIINTLDNEDED